MPVKYSKQHAEIIFTHVDFLAEMRVLHGAAPALHGTRTPSEMGIVSSFRFLVFNWCIEKPSHFLLILFSVALPIQ